MLLGLSHDGPLSSFAFYFNWRHYTLVVRFPSQRWHRRDGGHGCVSRVHSRGARVVHALGEARQGWRCGGGSGVRASQQWLAAKDAPARRLVTGTAWQILLATSSTRNSYPAFLSHLTSYDVASNIFQARSPSPLLTMSSTPDTHLSPGFSS
jgi:hypothetical protein